MEQEVIRQMQRAEQAMAAKEELLRVLLQGKVTETAEAARKALAYFMDVTWRARVMQAVPVILTFLLV